MTPSQCQIGNINYAEEEHLGLLITTTTDMRFFQPKYKVVIGDYHI